MNLLPCRRADTTRRTLLLLGATGILACSSVHPDDDPELWGTTLTELSINPYDAVVRLACLTARVARPAPDASGAFDVEGVVISASFPGMIGTPFRATGTRRPGFIILHSALGDSEGWNPVKRDSLVPGAGDFSGGATCIV